MLFRDHFSKRELAMTISGHGAEKYVTGRLLDGSHGRKWPNLLAERWTHQAGDLPSVLPRDTEIAMFLRGRSVVERQGGGVRQRTHGRRGTIWLCPAGIREEYINVSEPVEDCLHIYLPGQPFAETLLQDLDIDPSRMVLRYESVARDPFIEQIAERILQELTVETSAGRLLVESLSSALSAHLVHRYAATEIRLKAPAKSNKLLDERRLSRVIEFVEANIASEFAVSDMAKTACLSPAHFARQFKMTTGRTPHAFVSERRLALAKGMLVEAHRPITEIAYAAGFSSQANFARAFRIATNMTPGQFRAQAGAGPTDDNQH
jgi:AraC family transcriptional regulator